MTKWIPNTESKPETFNSVIVWGQLENEDAADAHEGYWSGKEWVSVRTREEDTGFHLRIHDVTHWMPRPSKP